MVFAVRIPVRASLIRVPYVTQALGLIKFYHKG
jgi:hypothetical protein